MDTADPLLRTKMEALARLQNQERQLGDESIKEQSKLLAEETRLLSDHEREMKEVERRHRSDMERHERNKRTNQDKFARASKELKDRISHLQTDISNIRRQNEEKARKEMQALENNHRQAA